MLKFVAAVLSIAIAAAAAAQTPTLQIRQPDGPNLPSELWYGNVKVKPLRFRPGTNTPVTIDDSDFFVNQNYIDFFGRFPDTGGFNFWVGQINCGVDQTCIYNRRVAVSASFFISAEFQQTGYYVYRFYAGTLGRQPTYPEFQPDRLQIDPAAANIEATKNAFANAWVQRPAFLAQHPEADNAGFVNGILTTMKNSKDIANNNVGYDLTSQAQKYIDELTNQGKSRGAVVREIVDDSGFQDKEKNPSFVLMQYFGYLRRDPDVGGYNFWLNDSNAGLNLKPPTDHAYQTMVCAFVTSAEYQLRFGSTATQNDRNCEKIP